MERVEGLVNQNKGIEGIVNFVRDYALVQDRGGRPSITSRGKRFLEEMQAMTDWSESEHLGAVLK